VSQTASPNLGSGSALAGTPDATVHPRARYPGPLLRAASVVALTAALWVLYGPAHLGYDPTWALAWGAELASGSLPRLDASPAAPTPHPLANALGALLSPLGASAAPIAFSLVVFASLAALGLVCAEIGIRLIALPVGAFFALLVLTRLHLVHEALISSTDVAFVALALGALLLVAEAPRRGWAPLGLLAAAGLLRPEAWGFALLYGAYLVLVARPRGRLALGGLALTGPVVWMLVDLVVTGNPIFSLEGTQDLAARLNRPTGLALAVDTLADRLEMVVGQPTLWLGLAGWAVALWARFERAWLLSLVVVLGFGGYLLLGLAELPLLSRYLVLPGAVLVLFAAVLVFGWTDLERGRVREVWKVASLVPLAIFVITVPDQVHELRDDSLKSAASRAAQADLEELLASPTAARQLRRCGPVRVHDFRVRPLVWYWAGVRPEAIQSGLVGNADRGTYVTPQAGPGVVRIAARTAFYKEGGVPPRLLAAPPGARVAASSEGWRLDVVGCG
jgi:hypothetical protein